MPKRSKIKGQEEKRPKYQALCFIKVDIRGTYEKLQKAGLNPTFASERVEAQFDIELEDPHASALFSPSSVQIYCVSRRDVYKTIEVLQKYLVDERGQPSLLESLSRIEVPQIDARIIELMLKERTIRNQDLVQRLQKREDNFLTLVNDLRAIHPETRGKIKPVLKRALERACNYYRKEELEDKSRDAAFLEALARHGLKAAWTRLTATPAPSEMARRTLSKRLAMLADLGIVVKVSQKVVDGELKTFYTLTPPHYVHEGRDGKDSEHDLARS